MFSQNMYSGPGRKKKLTGGLIFFIIILLILQGGIIVRALNLAVTADNYKDFLDSTKINDAVSTQLDESTSPKKKVWLDIYNSADNFLGSTYVPLLQQYDKLLNLDVEYIQGDGQTESNITNRLADPSAYDAFAINMVETDNAASYTALLQ